MRRIDVDQLVRDDCELTFRDVAVIAVDGRVLCIVHRGAVGVGVGERFLIGEKGGTEPDVVIEGLSPMLPS